MDPYASRDDLDAWLGDSIGMPSNADQLLRSATLLVARALNENPYTPPTIDQPRKDAVCAQAAAWAASALDPTAGPAGVAKIATSKTLEGASVTYQVANAATREQAVSMLAPDAYNILFAAGLLWVPLPQWSETPDQGQYVNEFGVVGGNAGFSSVIF